MATLLFFSHGPFNGGSHFLYLYGKLGPDGDYSQQVGRIFSPEYTQSATECKLDLFYYMNGDTGTLTDSENPAALGKIDNLMLKLSPMTIYDLRSWRLELICLSSVSLLRLRSGVAGRLRIITFT